MDVVVVESGIDEAATNKFPGSEVKVGSAATGREIPVEEGGDINKATGQYVSPSFARLFL